MSRDQVFADVAAKHARRTEAARRTIAHAPDIMSAREALRQAVSALPGVSADPDTVPDIMSFVDQFVSRDAEDREASLTR